MKIPLQNFDRHVKEFRGAVEQRLKLVQDRANFILGPEVEEFERRFSDYIGAARCVAVANGTQAMELALRALPSREGEVVTTANAGMYATCAILSAGFTPVYCEIDPVLMTPDPESFRRSITRKTRAFIATHLYGQAADIHPIVDICKSAGIMLIEDCAEAHGAKVGERKVGSFGCAGCFSFYPTKNLGAYGDAGAIVTNDTDFADRLRSLRQYGWSQKYQADASGGLNSRMDEMQAAVLNVKLPYLDSMNARRRKIVARYNEILRGRAKHLPFTTNDCFIVHHYVLRSAHRKKVMQALHEEGVGTEIHFPVPDYQQTAVAGLADRPYLPETDRACAEVFTIPSFPEMTDGEVEHVCRALVKFYQP